MAVYGVKSYSDTKNILIEQNGTISVSRKQQKVLGKINEKRTVNGTTNPFEYYFCQPTGISLLQAKNSFNVINVLQARTQTRNILHKNTKYKTL